MIRFISIHKLRNATKQALCSLFISLLCFTFLGCEGQKTPQEQAIEGYMQGLFGGDLDKYLRYSSYGFALKSMGNSNLANLFVAAESAQAAMLKGYKKVEILSIKQDDLTQTAPHTQNTQDSSPTMPTATALVRIHFGTAIVETELHLVNYEQDNWIINSELSLTDTIRSQLHD